MASLARAASLASVAGALLTLAVGLTHLVHDKLDATFCESSAESCVGPYLKWNKDFFSVKDSNAAFRGVFSVRPAVVGAVFPAIAWAAFALHAHHEPARSWAARTWARLAALHLGLALFANFAFAGGFGIAAGFFNSGVSAACLFVHFTSPARDVVTVDVWGAVRSPKCTVSALNMSRLVQVADVLSLVATLLVFVAGAFHLAANDVGKWCRDPEDCVGPLLRWPSRDFFATVNANGWGSLFSNDPDKFLDVWGAVILAVVTLLVPAETWWGLAFWHVFLALFGAFGVAGNVGILVGFFSSAVAALVALVALAAPPPSETGPRYVLLA